MTEEEVGKKDAFQISLFESNSMIQLNIEL